jgi:hypothetical protein
MQPRQHMAERFLIGHTDQDQVGMRREGRQ